MLHWIKFTIFVQEIKKIRIMGTLLSGIFWVIKSFSNLIGRANNNISELLASGLLILLSIILFNILLALVIAPTVLAFKYDMVWFLVYFVFLITDGFNINN